jgi:ATP-dependent DNA helicase RecG
VRVTFWKDPYTPEQLKKQGLNERQIKAVLYAKEKGSITNRDYRSLTGVSDETTRQELAQLASQGLLQVHGKGRATRYVLPKFGD